MIEWITEVIGRGGLWGLMFLTFIENIFPPVSSEIVMPCVGYLVKTGHLNFLHATASGALGSTMGSLPLYYLSRSLGEKRVRGLMARYGKWIGLGAEEYDNTKSWFTRFGSRAVLWCRMIPGLRGIISVPAGIANLPIFTFLVMSFLGCFLWTFLLVMAGYLLGDSFIKVEHILGPASKFILIALVVFLVWRAYKKHTQSKDDVQQPHVV